MRLPVLSFDLSRIARALLAVSFLTALGIALYTAAEALEERGATVAVTDVRIAVLDLADVAPDEPIGPSERSRILSSVRTIEASTPAALHAIEPWQRDLVADELALIADHGAMMLSGEATTAMAHGMLEHRALEAELREGSIAAAAEAVTAERRAEVAALISIASLILLSLAMLQARSAKEREAAMAEVAQGVTTRLAAVLDSSRAAIAVIDADTTFAYCSTTFRARFGDLAGASIDELLSSIQPEDRDALTARLTGRDAETHADSDELLIRSLCADELGRIREFAVTVADGRNDPLIEGIVATFTDTTATNAAQRRLAELANRDPLTELPNRRALMHRLLNAQAHDRALLMVDLDDFKGINDRHGHDAGDAVLTEVARRFRHCEAGELFRLGGDEFAVLTDTSDIDVVRSAAECLITSLHEPIDFGTGIDSIGASVGIACDASGTSSPSALLRRSDQALYAAKADGGQRSQVLNAEIEQRATRLRVINDALQLRETHSQFRVVYQPIVDTATARVVAVEALARWRHPELGNVRPDEFIPIAERNGAIADIGRWVLADALAALKGWIAAGASPDLRISVNVSPRQLSEPSFADEVIETLATAGVAPDRLAIEVTESALVEPGAEEVAQLERLRARGCIVACDDFGAGYSNLGQLMALPIDVIKVDRQLLLHLSEMREQAGGSNDEPCQVMSAIVTIGDAMGAPILAEGVETKVQAESLRISGVRYLQGYYYGRPAPAGELSLTVSKPELATSAAGH